VDKCFLASPPEMEAKELEFLEKALKVFMKYGIKSVTMDDMARHLGMSKKTIYTYVSDKNDLVSKVLSVHTESDKERITCICNRGLNAIDEMFEIGIMVTTMLAEMHPAIHYDLEKYHTQAFKENMAKHEHSIYECILSNLNKGIVEGLYREDLNADVIARLYMKTTEVIWDNTVFPPTEISFDKVYSTLFRYHIAGVASEKGSKYLNKKLKSLKTNTL
jgi:TetR/AcrR family transcriptional regulator, cholesterol catabolism regulator